MSITLEQFVKDSRATNHTNPYWKQWEELCLLDPNAITPSEARIGSAILALRYEFIKLNEKFDALVERIDDPYRGARKPAKEEG